jgi:hypothetical protein
VYVAPAGARCSACPDGWIDATVHVPRIDAVNRVDEFEAIDEGDVAREDDSLQAASSAVRITRETRETKVRVVLMSYF